MRTDFSEFSYGMAVTYEAIAWLGGITGMRAAPVMPSLRDEVSGGYDLHLDTVYAGIYMQFKRPEFLVGPRATERAYFGGDYFRFPLRNSSRSPRHSTLCELQRQRLGRNDWVAYASAMFWQTTELDHLFRHGQVCDHSIFVNPMQIGDYEPASRPGHSVAYTGQHDVNAVFGAVAARHGKLAIPASADCSARPDCGWRRPTSAYLLDLLGLEPRLSEDLDLSQIVAAAVALTVRLDLQLVLVGSGPPADG